jgi:hypothetical protein
MPQGRRQGNLCGGMGQLQLAYFALFFSCKGDQVVLQGKYPLHQHPYRGGCTMKRFAVLAGVACLCSGVLTGTGRAGFIDFTYSGSEVGGTLTSSVGSGSFTFADSPTTLTLADLTSFTFTQTATSQVDPSHPSTYNYALSDLTSFSATLTPGGLLTGLTLTTDAVGGSNLGFASESFQVTSLATGGAGTFRADVSSGIQLTAGTVTQTVTPEPASLTLLGLGVASLASYAWRRRR